MKTIGERVRVIAQDDFQTGRHRPLVRGVEHGTEGTVVRWVRQPEAPLHRRWIVTVSTGPGREGSVNYFPEHLAFADGRAFPARPDPDEGD